MTSVVFGAFECLPPSSGICRVLACAQGPAKPPWWSEISEVEIYRFLSLLAEFDRRGGHVGLGLHSCAHWLSWKCGIGLIAAREKVRVARALETLPKIRAAMQRGTLSYCMARAITRVATPQNEEYLLYIAESGTVSHVEKLVRLYRKNSRSKELAKHNAQRAERRLQCFVDEDGSLVIQGLTVGCAQGQQRVYWAFNEFPGWMMDGTPRFWLAVLVVAGVGACSERGASGDPEPGVVSGCPDTSQPPPEPECTGAREPTADKWSQRDEVIWSMAPDPHPVTIMVRGAGQLCACPSRPNTCPDQDELFRYVEEWNARSQRCVRALIDELGGSATGERSFIANTIHARLSWAQIQSVAAHPHVEMIGADGGEDITLPGPDAGVGQPSDECEEPVNVLGNEAFYAERPEAEQEFRGPLTFRPVSGAVIGRVHEFFVAEMPVTGGGLKEPLFLERIGKYVVVHGKQFDIGYGPEIMPFTISACE